MERQNVDTYHLKSGAIVHQTIAPLGGKFHAVTCINGDVALESFDNETYDDAIAALEDHDSTLKDEDE